MPGLVRRKRPRLDAAWWRAAEGSVGFRELRRHCRVGLRELRRALREPNLDPARAAHMRASLAYARNAMGHHPLTDDLRRCLHRIKEALDARG